MEGQGRTRGGGNMCGADGGQELLPVREAAARALACVPGAFLRCDRGHALYVSDAPMRPGFDGPALERALAAAGFCARPRGRMLEITPGHLWPPRLTEWVLRRVRPDELYRLLARPLPPLCQAEAFALWLRGVKRMELGATAGELARLERDLRAAAALAMRLGGGGGFADAAACVLSMKYPRTREREG